MLGTLKGLSILIIINILIANPINGQGEMKELISIPWKADNGIKTSLSHSGNYGIREFTIIDSEELAICTDTENDIKIFSLKNGNLIREFKLKNGCKRFEYNPVDNRFYVATSRHVDVYTRSGTFMRSIPMHQKLNPPAWLTVVDGDVYVIRGGESYPVLYEGDVQNLNEQIGFAYKAIILEKNFIVTTRRAKNGMALFSYSRDLENMKDLSFPVDSNCVGLTPLGKYNDRILFIQYDYVTGESFDVDRHILEYSISQNRVIASIKMPKILYVSIKTELRYYNGTLYHLLTTPDKSVLYSISNRSGPGKSLLQGITYPDSLMSYSFHYNNILLKENQ
jgi:hypothetical protein